MLTIRKPEWFRLKEWVVRLINLQVQSYSFSANLQRIISPLKTESRVKTDKITQDKKDVQARRTRAAFMERPKTMMEVSVETGILRANICRYVAEMHRALQIQVHHYGIDPITKASGVQFLTTDPALFVKPIVPPTLFD